MASFGLACLGRHSPFAFDRRHSICTYYMILNIEIEIQRNTIFILVLFFYFSFAEYTDVSFTRRPTPGLLNQVAAQHPVGALKTDRIFLCDLIWICCRRQRDKHKTPHSAFILRSGVSGVFAI